MKHACEIYESQSYCHEMTQLYVISTSQEKIKLPQQQKPICDCVWKILYITRSFFMSINHTHDRKATNNMTQYVYTYGAQPTYLCVFEQSCSQFCYANLAKQV